MAPRNRVIRLLSGSRIHYHTRVIIYHTPWDEFQTRFPPKNGGTHNENGRFGKHIFRREG